MQSDDEEAGEEQTVIAPGTLNIHTASGESLPSFQEPSEEGFKAKDLGDRDVPVVQPKLSIRTQRSQISKRRIHHLIIHVLPHKACNLVLR